MSDILISRPTEVKHGRGGFLKRCIAAGERPWTMGHPFKIERGEKRKGPWLNLALDDCQIIMNKNKLLKIHIHI